MGYQAERSRLAKAVADGVEIALWDFLVKQQRWPNKNEYDALKKRSLELQAETRVFLRIQKENGGIKSDSKGWINTLNRKRDKLKQLAQVG